MGAGNRDLRLPDWRRWAASAAVADVVEEIKTGGRQMSQDWRSFPHARLISFYDADTISVEVDQGFGCACHIRVRLFGLCAPELTGDERAIGKEALRIAKEIANLPLSCGLWTWKQSFSRYVGRIVFDNNLDLAREIIARGGGRAWDGRTARPQFLVPLDVNLELIEYSRLLARDFNQ